MISVTATSSAQSDIAADFPPAILTHDEGDREEEGEGTGAGSQVNDASAESSSIQQHTGQVATTAAQLLAQKGVPMNQLYPQHQPITLVNGQRINQGFRKPEKTKWTSEEGTHSSVALI